MSERHATNRGGVSRRLPPPEAWKKYDQWVRPETGTVRRKKSWHKLELPTDDRGFVMPAQAVAYINETLFWDDYDWPYDANDPQTRPDQHHFAYERTDYEPKEHAGSLVPRTFRELPTMIGRMPRQFHNTIHDLTQKPPMPELDAMREYVSNYQLARVAFQRLIDQANQTLKATATIEARRRDIRQNPERLDGRVYDEIGEAFIRSNFDKYFQSYHAAVKHFLGENYHAVRFYQQLGSVSEVRPGDFRYPAKVIKKIGSLASLQCLNFVPVLRAA